MQRREEGVTACRSILWFYKGINIDGERLEQRWSILVMNVIGRLTNDRWLSRPYGRGKSKNKNREPAKIKATARRNIYILKQLVLARGKFYQYRPYWCIKIHIKFRWNRRNSSGLTFSNIAVLFYLHIACSWRGIPAQLNFDVIFLCFHFNFDIN